MCSRSTRTRAGCVGCARTARTRARWTEPRPSWSPSGAISSRSTPPIRSSRARAVRAAGPELLGVGHRRHQGDYLIAAARGEAVDVETIALAPPDHRRRRARLRSRDAPRSSLQKRRKRKPKRRKAGGRALPPRAAAARARVASLARFQTEALRKALSFPSAERVLLQHVLRVPRGERACRRGRASGGPAAGLRARARPAGVAPTRLAGTRLARRRGGCARARGPVRGRLRRVLRGAVLAADAARRGEAAAAAVAAETKAREDLEAARAKKRAASDGSGGVRPVYRAGRSDAKKARRPCFGDSRGGAVNSPLASY